jgi:hypothetical protein
MTASDLPNWQEKLDETLENRPAGDARAYGLADAESIKRALVGLGPEDAANQASGGARIVFNISSAHVPAFVEASLADGPTPYKNGYDTGKLRIGAEPKDRTRRERMDRALACVVDAVRDSDRSRSSACDPSTIYYGAVELNGTGVRFYGDVSLVLAGVNSETTILDRNSYDLLRAPLGTDAAYKDSDDEDLCVAARRIAGRWGRDLAAIAALKVLSLRPVVGHRITTGDISDGLLRDEDYVEVLRLGSFAASDLQEARITAADVAREALVLERERHGSLASLASHAWVQQRRAAEAALARARVEVRIVTESGRVKS